MNRQTIADFVIGVISEVIAEKEFAGIVPIVAHDLEIIAKVRDERWATDELRQALKDLEEAGIIARHPTVNGDCFDFL